MTYTLLYNKMSSRIIYGFAAFLCLCRFAEIADEKFDFGNFSL